MLSIRPLLIPDCKPWILPIPPGQGGGLRGCARRAPGDRVQRTQLLRPGACVCVGWGGRVEAGKQCVLRTHVSSCLCACACACPRVRRRAPSPAPYPASPPPDGQQGRVCALQRLRHGAALHHLQRRAAPGREAHGLREQLPQLHGMSRASRVSRRRRRGPPGWTRQARAAAAMRRPAAASGSAAPRRWLVTSHPLCYGRGRRFPAARPSLSWPGPIAACLCESRPHTRPHTASIGRLERPGAAMRGARSRHRFEWPPRAPAGRRRRFGVYI